MEKYWEVKIPLSNPENKKIINEFLLSLKVANYSKGTIIEYRYFLEHFFREIKEPFSSLSSNHIQTWFLLHEKGYKETTISRHLSTLSSFYTFCVNESYLEKSPIKTRWYPRLPKPVPKYLDKEEIAKVRLHCEKESLRTRALVEFLLSSGCRVGEVHRLNRVDVDLEFRTARVVGKGKKIREVHFSEKSALLLERYLETRNDDNPALFVSQRGTRLSIIRIQQIVSQIGEGAEISTSLHAHRFRHTFASELLAKGADLSFIGDELGHSDLQTTQVYARLPNQEIITMYRKYMG